MDNSTLGPAAKRFLDDALARFEVDSEAENALLLEAARTIDNLEALDAAIAEDGVMVDGKPNPALVEARLQRVTLARLVAALRLPDSEGQRPQHRGAPRGVYRQPRGVITQAALREAK